MLWMMKHSTIYRLHLPINVIDSLQTWTPHTPVITKHPLSWGVITNRITITVSFWSCCSMHLCHAWQCLNIDREWVPSCHQTSIRLRYTGRRLGLYNSSRVVAPAEFFTHDSRDTYTILPLVPYFCINNQLLYYQTRQHHLQNHI